MGVRAWAFCLGLGLPLHGPNPGLLLPLSLLLCYEELIAVPKHLHKKRSFHCYPPLPETKVITYEMLSPKAKKLLTKKVGKTAAKNYRSKKLISSLENKRRYKMHYLNLQQALNFGCKLKKVHRVISFKQVKYLFDLF